MAASVGTVVGLIKALSPKIDPETIESAVSDWLDDHPEATTTVEDGSITKAKLDSTLSGYADDVPDLKSAITHITNADDVYMSAKKDVTAGTGILATTILINVNIPTGSQYIVNISGPSGIINKFTLYETNDQGTRTSLGSGRTINTPYYHIASEEIRAFSIYTTGTNVLLTGTITIEVTVLNSARNRLSASNIYSGKLVNGTGEVGRETSYSRLVVPIVCEKGTKVICDAYNMTVFEFDVDTGEYLTDNGGWTHSYAVQNDCAILIMWQASASNASDLIAKTILSPTQRIVSESALPINNIKNIANKTTQKYLLSETIISIAHRGDYTQNRGMPCGGSAVISAKRRGYRATENDIAVTADGKLVMWHDTTLAAIGDDSHGVSDYTLAELKAMDFGSSWGVQFAGEKILTFAEWILLCKQVGVECYIDFKVTGNDFTDSMAQEVAETVLHYGMKNKVTYLSNFNKIRQYHPDARLAYLGVPNASNIQTMAPYLENGTVAFNPKITDLTSEYAQAAFDNGFELECWFADYGTAELDKAAVFSEIKRAVGLGIQRITLDTYRVEDVFDEEYGLL